MGCACEALLLSRGSVHDVSVSWSQVPLWCQVCLGLTSSSEGSKNRVRSWALKAQERQRAFAGSPQGDDYRLGGRFGGTSWCNQKMLSLVQPLPIRKIRPQGSGSVSSTRDTGGVNSAGAQQLAAWRPLCPCSSAWAAAPPTYLPRAPGGLWCITPHRDGALPFHPNTVGGETVPSTWNNVWRGVSTSRGGGPTSSDCRKSQGTMQPRPRGPEWPPTDRSSGWADWPGLSLLPGVGKRGDGIPAVTPVRSLGATRGHARWNLH